MGCCHLHPADVDIVAYAMIILQWSSLSLPSGLHCVGMVVLSLGRWYWLSSHRYRGASGIHHCVALMLGVAVLDVMLSRCAGCGCTDAGCAGRDHPDTSNSIIQIVHGLSFCWLRTGGYCKNRNGSTGRCRVSVHMPGPEIARQTYFGHSNVTRSSTNPTVLPTPTTPIVIHRRWCCDVRC